MSSNRSLSGFPTHELLERLVLRFQPTNTFHIKNLAVKSVHLALIAICFALVFEKFVLAEKENEIFSFI